MVGPLDFGLDPNLKMALPFRVIQCSVCRLRHRETHLVWLEVLTLTFIHFFFSPPTYSMSFPY